jgi:diguanylate cyclase (GGDEF)-like protein/PAS domain S-box-containing protein
MKKYSDTLITRFRKTIHFLIEPPPNIIGIQRKRQVRLLSGLLLILILVGNLFAIIQLLTVPGFLFTFLVSEGAFVILTIAYFLTRTRYYLAAAIITSLIPFIAPYISLLVNPNFHSAFAYMLIAVLLGSILLDRWLTIGIAALNLVGLFLLPIVQPAWTFSGVGEPISFHIIISTLIIVAMRHRDLVEGDRQKELSESELKFRSIFNSSVDAIGVSTTGIHVTANPAYLRMFGYESADQLAGKPILDLIAPSHHPQILDFVRRRAAGEDIPNAYETRGLRRNGSEFDMEVHVSAYELDGEIYTVPILRDITERKLVVEQIRYQANLLKNVSDVIIASDLNFKILSWNQAAEALYGWRADEVIGKPVSEVLRTEYLAESAEHVRQQFMELGVWKGEVIQKHRDGTRLYILSSVSTVINDNGQLAGAVAVNRDITERRHTEEKLRRSEERYRIVTELISDYIFKLDIDSKGNATVGYLSENFDGITGRTLDQVKLTETWNSILHPDDLGLVMNLLRTIIATCESGELECRSYVKEGRQRWIHIVARPVVNQDSGSVTEIIGSVKDITERKQAEETLRLNEERYRTLAQNLPDSALLLYDQDLRFIIADGPEIEATGFSREILEGKTVHEALPPEFVQIVEPNLRRTLAGETFSAELPFGGRYYRYSYVPLRDNSGNVVMAMILATNITQLKKTEDALKDSQRRLSTALRATKVGVWEWNMRTDRTYWSDENYRVMGLEPGSIESRYENWANMVHPDDLPAAQAKVTEAVNTRSELNIEFRVVWPDGSNHWINDIGSLIFDENNEPIGMYGIQMDITERKLIQQELDENRRRLAFLLSKSPVVIYSSRASGDFGATFISENVTKQLGYQPEEFTENSGFWAEKIHPDDFPLVNTEIDRLFEFGSHSYEYRFHHNDGHYLWMQDEMILIRDESGNPLEIIGSWSDITERRRMEELLFEEKERAEITLHSIGDAVITTGVSALVEYLNPVAENLTGWNLEEAVGQPLENVFRIIEEGSRQPALSPVERCLREGKVVGLANHSILVRRDGREFSIDDSAAPIRNRNEEMIGVVLVFHDVTEERRLSRQAAHDAMHDSLTGLVNRGEFEKRLARALINTKEHNISHILCYLDLDQFKIVNDTAGHAAGDELLKQISRLLEGLFRQRDTLARLGGDEFGLLLENCQLDQALIIANEIKAKIRDFPFLWAGHGFQVGVSIGVVPITAEKESVNQLLSQADIACYSAKDLGRDRIYVYHAEDSETTQRHSEILQAARMRDAILNDQFRLFCQPIVQLTGEEGMLQYEVLLRMTDRDGGLVLPGAFIPPAERYGLMHAIDRWVIRKTLLTLTNHNIQRMLVNINLSGNSLDDETLLEYVLGQLNEFSILAGHVCFEITETAAIHHLSKAQQFIHAFRGRGGRIALDDFGSGFSSFRYLKTLPVDYIKIDGSFVSDMLSNPGDLLMVEAITKIAHTLGIKIIAEHASNIGTINRLREMGVDHAQGFGIGLPVPVEEAWKSQK